MRMWNINANLARIQSNTFSFVLDLEKPTTGLHEVSHQSFEIDAQLLQVHASIEPQIADTYTRGSDLVVAYHQTHDLKPQISWTVRTVADQQAVRLDATLSMQTSLLASDPASKVISRVPSCDLFALALGADRLSPLAASDLVDDSHAVLARPSGEDWSIAQLVHPHDCLASRLSESPNGVELTHDLFNDNLEKGVILKGRACLLLLPRHNDAEIARAEFQEFVAAPLPLTT